jgi:hypothetical protein
MWFEIQEVNAVWYFDATGCVIKDLKNQSMPFLYSIIMHDKKTKTLIPVAEFISTIQNSTWISSNLFFIKTMMIENVRNKNKIAIAPVMVTDMSWALINAIHEAFNNCSIVQYLKWSYDVVTARNINFDMHSLMRVRTYLCSVHFLKIMKTHAKSKLHGIEKERQKNILKTFLFSFSILQNSKTLDEFEDNFKDFYFVFTQKFQNDLYLTSIVKMKEKLASRDDENVLNEILATKWVVDDVNTIFSVECSKKIKENSPYVNHFSKIVQSLVTTASIIKSNIKNDFCYPVLFELIFEYIHLVPLWSGFIICDWQMKAFNEIRFTIQSNNAVEGYFKHLKNNLIPKHSMPSQLVGAIYEMLQMKYFLHYYKDESINKKPSKLPEKLEKWQKKRICKREKGFYYKNNQQFGHSSYKSNESVDLQEFPCLEHDGNYNSKTINT